MLTFSQMGPNHRRYAQMPNAALSDDQWVKILFLTFLTCSSIGCIKEYVKFMQTKQRALASLMCNYGILSINSIWQHMHQATPSRMSANALKK